MVTIFAEMVARRRKPLRGSNPQGLSPRPVSNRVPSPIGLTLQVKVEEAGVEPANACRLLPCPPLDGGGSVEAGDFALKPDLHSGAFTTLATPPRYRPKAKVRSGGVEPPLREPEPGPEPGASTIPPRPRGAGLGRPARRTRYSGCQRTGVRKRRSPLGLGAGGGFVELELDASATSPPSGDTPPATTGSCWKS